MFCLISIVFLLTVFFSQLLYFQRNHNELFQLLNLILYLYTSKSYVFTAIFFLYFLLVSIYKHTKKVGIWRHKIQNLNYMATKRWKGVFCCNLPSTKFFPALNWENQGFKNVFYSASVDFLWPEDPKIVTKKKNCYIFLSLAISQLNFHINYFWPKGNYPLLAAAAAAAKSLQSCPTLCNPIDGSPPGSPVPGILQARTLEWGAISFSNAWKWKLKVKSLSRVRLLATLWTAA